MIDLWRAATSIGRVCFCSSALFLAGCAQYTPLPLPANAPLANQPPVQNGNPNLPLSVPQVVTLALQQNLDLKAMRARHGVAQSQLLQAGILPNPSLSGSLLPLLSGMGSVPAWSVGLTQDIKSLITYRTKVRAADFSAHQVDAEILWQEWQVAGQARQLTVDFIMGERLRPLLAREHQLLLQRNDLEQKALQAGDTTLVAAAPTLAALQTTRTGLDALDQRQLHLRHQLNALLGLVPSAVLTFADDPQLPPFDPVNTRASLPGLGDRRPDLLALRLGYDAQNQVVRQQILSQFPDLILGAVANSDNSSVINAGPQGAVGLPIFDRNQGNVAIAEATRMQLNADYAARLATATGEAGSLLREWEQLSAQLARVRADLPQARMAAERATAAFNSSLLDERSFVELTTNDFTKEKEVVTLEQALLDRQIALQTLLGVGLPTVDTLGASNMAAQQP